jgi:membrane protease YdiL (CAAX protease family)
MVFDGSLPVVPLKRVGLAVSVYFAIALSVMLSCALFMYISGTAVGSGVAALFVTLLMMWGPFLGRIGAVHLVDQSWKTPFSLRKWGFPRAWVIGGPLSLVLVIYGLSYLIGVLAGVTTWSPGRGAWDTASRVILNLAINLPILTIVFTIGAMGEELGWRGYLQPRLDAAGVKYSLAIVIALEVIWHLPVMVWGGYLLNHSLAITVLLFAGIKAFASPLWAWAMYRADSIWPAIFFHSFHNLVSQWLYPKLFAEVGQGVMLGEFGVLPIASYGVATGLGFISMYRKKLSWEQLAVSAIERCQRKARLTTA